MAEPMKDTDQSMEDILQSIKRIIADEGDVPPVTMGSDVLELTDILDEEPAQPALAEPAATPQHEADFSIDDLLAAPLAAAPVREEKPLAPREGSLMSEATVAASIAALDALSHTPAPVHATYPSAQLRSGTTIEDMVVEALRPMLKEWLDDNLPTLVKSLVEKEIRRLSHH